MRGIWTLFAITLLLGAVGCPPADRSGGDAGRPAASPADEAGGDDAIDVAVLRKKAGKLFGELPEHAWTDGKPSDELISLGRQLYFETRLSKNQDISCNTCHDLTQYGIDTRAGATSKGHKDQAGERNSPTVYNAALQVSQFWDGRAKTIEEQATMPVVNPVEMAMPDPDHVVTVLKSIPGYVDAFAAAFPEAGDEPITIENVGVAIGAFERGLLTPAPFDAWLAGKDDALSSEQVKGLSVYVEQNCQMCHAGNLLGGNMVQKLGLQEEWPTENEDEGAGGFMFKVPSLRNVTKTAPYLHDGSISDLVKLTQMMGQYQVGAEISEADAQAIVAFLSSLEGELPTDYIKQPELPESGPDAPAADPN